MKVKDLMTPNPISIDPEAPLHGAIEVMRTKRVRHLPVVDDAGQLLGIVTDRDVRQAALAPAVRELLSPRAERLASRVAEELHRLRVKNVMSWAVVSTTPESPLGYAVLMMSERRIGCLPVVDAGRLVGLLTEHDVLAFMLQEGIFPEFAPDPNPW